MVGQALPTTCAEHHQRRFLFPGTRIGSGCAQRTLNIRSHGACNSCAATPWEALTHSSPRRRRGVRSLAVHAPTARARSALTWRRSTLPDPGVGMAFDDLDARGVHFSTPKSLRSADWLRRRPDLVRRDAVLHVQHHQPFALASSGTDVTQTRRRRGCRAVTSSTFSAAPSRRRPWRSATAVPSA